MRLKETLERIRPLDEGAMESARMRWNHILKPPGSLGQLEEHLVRIAGVTGSAQIQVFPKAVAVFCADNGVVRQGVAGFDPSLTALMAENLSRGDTCVCRMAKLAGAEVVPVDVGISTDVEVSGLLQRKVAYGTRDFSQEEAMSHNQVLEALEVGVEVAEDLAGRGCRLLAAGEMGIGNTTSSAAVAAVMLGIPPKQATGRGAGLSDEGLTRKITLVEEAVARWAPDREDPLGVLRKVGGLDIAAMAGFYLGAAACRVPVVLDGVISGAAALVADKLHPLLRGFLLPSHVSAEPAGRWILNHLELAPLLQAGMRLGEGTGAVATFPLYDMMAELYHNMLTFSDLPAGAGQ